MELIFDDLQLKQQSDHQLIEYLQHLLNDHQPNLQRQNIENLDISSLFKDKPSLRNCHPKVYAAIALFLELQSRAHLKAASPRHIFNNPQVVQLYLRSELAHRRKEVFWALFLDSQHQLIDSKALFFGTIDSAAIYPREVVIQALFANAAAVIFAHNHPSGIAEPSAADRQITQKLTAALNLIDIRVLDHFVVGSNEVISFAQRGWV